MTIPAASADAELIRLADDKRAIDIFNFFVNTVCRVILDGRFLFDTLRRT